MTRGDGGTVLLLDDEPAVVRLIEAILCLDGYHVLTARDSYHACELAESYPGRIDLMLVNFTFRGKSSTEVAEQIRNARPEAKLLQISGRSPDVLRQERRLVPDAAFLCKPFTANELRDAVGHVLHGDGRRFSFAQRQR